MYKPNNPRTNAVKIKFRVMNAKVEKIISVDSIELK